MPYNISDENGQWLVRKKSTGKIIGRHSSRKKAVAQVRAIYANSTEKNKRAA